MKTVLAPNAPWPEVGEFKERKQKQPNKKPENTDKNFERWLSTIQPIKENHGKRLISKTI